MTTQCICWFQYYQQQLKDLGSVKRRECAGEWTPAVAQKYGKVLRRMSVLNKLAAHLSKRFIMGGEGENDGAAAV